MEIVRHADLMPAAWDAICRVPETVWAHRAQAVLHPRTTYARAIAKIIDAWLDVFPALDALSSELRFEQPAVSAKLLEQRYIRLLHALNEHFDACYSVIRCLHAPQRDKAEWHEHAARRQNPPGLKAFDEQAVKGYRDARLGRIVNLLKHDHARLSLLSMRTDLFGASLTLGYFVDGPLPSGAIGPAPRVHRGGNSAFSFNRDMLLNWWWLYRTSKLLASIVEATSSRTTKVATEVSPLDDAVPADVSPKLVELCREIAALRLDFMPDEVGQPFPLVLLPPHAQFMRIVFPANRRANPIRGEPRFTGLLTVDSVGQSYKIPYLAWTTTRRSSTSDSARRRACRIRAASPRSTALRWRLLRDYGARYRGPGSGAQVACETDVADRPARLGRFPSLKALGILKSAQDDCPHSTDGRACSDLLAKAVRRRRLRRLATGQLLEGV